MQGIPDGTPGGASGETDDCAKRNLVQRTLQCALPEVGVDTPGYAECVPCAEAVLAGLVLVAVAIWWE